MSEFVDEGNVFHSNEAESLTQTDLAPQFSVIATPLSPKSHDLLPQFRAMLDETMNNHLSDVDCERFLIARNCNLHKAHDMITKYYNWYYAPLRDFKIANPELRPIDLGTQCADNKEHLMPSLLEYSFTGRAKDGYPIYWEKSGQIAANFGKFRKDFTDDEIICRHIHMLEMNRIRCENASRQLGHLIYKKITVLDIAGIPVFPDWHLYRTMQRFEEIDQNYYPETLKTLIIINAPVYFTAIWAVIKPWMDPITLTKVHICGHDYLSTLRTYIDDEQIPVEYGGKRENFPWRWPDCLEN